MSGAVRNRFRPGSAVALITTALCVVSAPLLSADYDPSYRPAAYAIKGARIHPAPGQTIDVGTVVLRGGVVAAIGPSEKVEIPFDAETIDGKDLVVYPGFIDLFTTLGLPSGVPRSGTGTGQPVKYTDYALARTAPDNRNGLTPEFEVARALELPDAVVDERRRLGFTDLLCAPGGAIATGRSVLASLSGLPRRESIVHTPVALHINLMPPFEPVAPAGHDDHGGRRGGSGGRDHRYPRSLMGVVAHLRQAMLDAEHAHFLHEFPPEKGEARPAFDPALETLYAARTKALPVWWEANTRDEIHRALDLAEEFGTSAAIVGGRDAAKAAERLKSLDVPVILRIDFPDEPKALTEAEYRRLEPAEREAPYKVLAERVARWKERAANAAVLAKAGVRFAFASEGLAKPETFHARIQKLIEAGLPPDAAIDALTRRAAQIAALEAKLGTIEPGKLAHLVVMTGPYGEGKSKPRYVFVDGFKFDLKAPAGRPASDDKKEAAKKEEPKADGAKGAPAAKAEAAKPEPAKPEAPKSEPARRESAKPEPPKPDPAKAEPAKGDAPKAEPPKNKVPSPANAAKTPEDQPSPTPFVDIAAEFEETRKPKIHTGGDVLIKDATILTVSKLGTIPKGSILVRKGKIEAVGLDLEAPPGVTVIAASGLVAMPGIVDTHAHIAIQGDVNETSLSIVPEVRVRDVVAGDDPAIYRALAGGTTTARLLHGSADTIGGQDAVVKMKHGLAARDLIIRDAPQGVKFALGENVTRDRSRFPNTRMGVEAVIERAFEEARAYRALWKAHASAKTQGDAGPPPRRDLRLEALAGVLDGSIKIHCHSYRSDEILMLLRVAARYGVKVQSLQHALEGYKVAPEIAAHGAAVSTFSDWWAYKVEAYDAIPFNAALLTQAGVSVSIKSDSEELMRHLNLEAAKMVKYGGMSEAQALAMITMHPALELGLQDRIGSIETGKDADIVLFNGHPFDGFARCELALIDGEVWFQRPEKDGGFGVRPGDHSTMPTTSHGVKAKTLEILHNPKGIYALVGATLHTLSGPDIADGTLVVADGKITTVGSSETRVPPAAQTIDAQGFEIWPGLVDAGSPLGLYEIGSLDETRDDADSATFQPELRTSSALHPDSELIPVTRANGVLSALVQPTGGVISGQSCVVGLDGWVPREMVLADPVALHVWVPRQVVDDPDAMRPKGDLAEAKQRRRERIEAIREQFRRALAYDHVVGEAQARGASPPTPDPRLAALGPYAKGLRPVIFHAEGRQEILDALGLIAELKLKGVISGGAEAWKVVDALKAAKVPVLLAGTLRLPSEPTDPYDAPYANPLRLFEAGVTFAIRSKGSGPDLATSARNLPYEAAAAVAYGLPVEEALKAVTITPAQILGVGDQVGTLEPGKRANLVISAGHILQPTTEIKALFLNGKPVSPESRHTQLYAKYRRRLAEVESGVAPLGIDPAPAPSLGPPPMPPGGNSTRRR